MPGKVILLVEDSAMDAKLFIRALEKGAIVSEIVIARDGVEALNYLSGAGQYAGREVTGLPQVVFLDLKMPKRDGFEVLKRIRSDERTRNLPVVIVTSSSEERDVI